MDEQRSEERKIGGKKDRRKERSEKQRSEERKIRGKKKSYEYGSATGVKQRYPKALSKGVVHRHCPKALSNGIVQQRCPMTEIILSHSK